MTSHRTDRVAYDDAETPHELYADCRAVGLKLRFDRIARAASAPPPSLHYDDFTHEVDKPEIAVDEAVRRLSDAIFGD
jgi:hypothetical protein